MNVFKLIKAALLIVAIAAASMMASAQVFPLGYLKLATLFKAAKRVTPKLLSYQMWSGRCYDQVNPNVELISYLFSTSKITGRGRNQKLELRAYPIVLNAVQSRSLVAADTPSKTFMTELQKKVLPTLNAQSPLKVTNTDFVQRIVRSEGSNRVVENYIYLRQMPSQQGDLIVARLLQQTSNADQTSRFQKSIYCYYNKTH